jgi:hypothetical protein
MLASPPAGALNSTPVTPLTTATDRSHFQIMWEETLLRYKESTGRNLLQVPFADQLLYCSSVDEVVHVLKEQNRSFQMFRSDNQKIRAVLAPVVRLAQFFLNVDGEVAGNSVSLLPNYIRAHLIPS